MLHKQRMEPLADDPFIVFIVGYRINKYWKVHKWLPVARAFQRMLKELDSNPALGCMGYEYWRGSGRMCIQYWRSYQQLLDYARDKNAGHFPAWFDFNSRISRSGDVGLWHEAYFAKPGTFKAVYRNMPPFGLGKATQLSMSKTTSINTEFENG
ncbi:MAG TPA: DUF4188 domain-containing protein [Gammaproteobacteria bacterium]